MNLDPFAAQKPKTTFKRQPQNFAEALKSIGGHSSSSNLDFYTSPNLAPDYLRQPEQSWERDQARKLRHKEVLQATPLYDRREEEVKAQIKAIQAELKALAKDIANLSLTTQKALNEAVTHPGKYHVSYLEKLRRFILTLRKQVADANNWLDLSYQRRQAKQYYWGGVQKGGTKFMLSQERQVATSAG